MCRLYKRIADGKNEKYCINETKSSTNRKFTKTVDNAKRNQKAGQSFYECSCDYQWLFLYINSMHSSQKIIQKQKKVHETAILEIARKEFQDIYNSNNIYFTIPLIEPKFSKISTL